MKALAMLALAVLLGALVGVGLGQLPAVKGPTPRADATPAQPASMTVTVMVASRPLGHRLVYDDIAQREVPGSVVSLNHITPIDAAKMVGSVLREPVEAGDPLTWSHVRRGPWAEAVAACIERFAGGLAAKARTAMATVAASESPLSVDDSVVQAMPVPDEVLVVASALSPGDVLVGGSLRITRAPAGLATRSWVPAAALSEVRGAQVLVSLAPGEPLLWQTIDDSKAPVSVLSCAAKASRAAAEAEAKASQSLFEVTP